MVSRPSRAVARNPTRPEASIPTFSLLLAIISAHDLAEAKTIK